MNQTNPLANRGFTRRTSFSSECVPSPSLARCSGGALVVVMLMICVLSVVATSILLLTTTRYHTTFQSASWQESIVGAEAGVDLAMNELRKRVVAGPNSAFKVGTASNNWTVTSPTGSPYPNYGHAFPANNQPYLFTGVDSAGKITTTQTHVYEGNTTMLTRVYIDVPGSDDTPLPTNFAVSSSDNNSYISQPDNPAARDADGIDRSHWWYRIRALGIAGVSGTVRPNLETLDNRLRHFSFFNDWRTGDTVPAPQVARMVEIIAQPQTNFRNALMADKQIDLSKQDVLVDSYDSSKGAYSSTTNHGTMGNIATNGKLINASHATVNGNAMTNNGTVNDGDNVTGQQSGNFYQELTPFTAGLLNPAWASVINGGTVTGNTTYTASVNATSPTLVLLNGINLPAGGKIINIAAPAAAKSASTSVVAPSYIKLYVQGDISTAGNSYINIDPNVNTIIYFTGNINLQGNGIINNSFLARQLVLNGLQPPANADGTYPSRSINIATTQDFEGIVYAPNHDLTLALQAAAATTSTGSTNPVTTTQIAALQQQIAAAQQNITALQADYTYNMNLYSTAPGNSGHKYLEVAQRDQGYIANLTAQINGYNASLLLLTGVNPDSSTDDHARGYNGIYGGYVANTITVSKKTHIHYDETLRTAGPVNHYEIVNWFEDNAARGATGSSTAFWWAGATSP